VRVTDYDRRKLSLTAFLIVVCYIYSLLPIFFFLFLSSIVWRISSSTDCLLVFPRSYHETLTLLSGLPRFYLTRSCRYVCITIWSCRFLLTILYSGPRAETTIRPDSRKPRSSKVPVGTSSSETIQSQTTTKKISIATTKSAPAEQQHGRHQGTLQPQP
jgi:hypothetical protein